MARTPSLRHRSVDKAPRHGAARVISKLGIGSRTQAARWIEEGRVRVNGRVVSDPDFPVQQGVDRISVDGHEKMPERLFVMLNKPRGLVTSTRDEQGRDTVYRCFDEAALPWLAPVGRLDKASEGLLLFSNDPEWAGRITHPSSGPCKTYHVQIDCLPDDALIELLVHGTRVDGQHLSARSVRCLRKGAKHGWLEITLDEGRNRQIRRLLEAFDVRVLRLIRVAIGTLSLGTLAKGQWRRLTPQEAVNLSTATPWTLFTTS